MSGGAEVWWESFVGEVLSPSDYSHICWQDSVPCTPLGRGLPWFLAPWTSPVRMSQAVVSQREGRESARKYLPVRWKPQSFITRPIVEEVVCLSWHTWFVGGKLQDPVHTQSGGGLPKTPVPGFEGYGEPCQEVSVSAIFLWAEVSWGASWKSRANAAKLFVILESFCFYSMPGPTTYGFPQVSSW